MTPSKILRVIKEEIYLTYQEVAEHSLIFWLLVAIGTAAIFSNDDYPELPYAIDHSHHGVRQILP
jgi:hypothetical protein